MVRMPTRVKIAETLNYHTPSHAEGLVARFSLTRFSQSE
jgi:hypothetical protein